MLINLSVIFVLCQFSLDFRRILAIANLFLLALRLRLPFDLFLLAFIENRHRVRLTTLRYSWGVLVGV